MPKLEFDISAESLAIIRDGQAALRWLDRDKTWEAWLRIGKAFVEVRTVAMQRAGTNRPFGPRYRDLFGLLLRQFKFTDRIKDSGDRARLVEVMEILPDIETWRNGLTPDERRRWNHPTTVLREYKKAQRKEMAGPDDDVFKPPTMAERHRALQSEVHELRKGAPLPWGPHDSPADKARAVLEHLSIVEAEELAIALLQAVKSARQDDDAPEVEPSPALEAVRAAMNEDSEGESTELEWTGDDEDGWLGRELVEGNRPIAYTVVPVSFRRLPGYFEVKLIDCTKADFTLSARRLADAYGMALTTNDHRNRVVDIEPFATPEEAKGLCERAFAQYG